MLIAGVRNLDELVAVVLLWGLPFAIVAAVPLIVLARRGGAAPKRFVLHLLAGLAGAIAGYAVGYRLYWNAFGPTPAIVYFLGGILIGGLCGILTSITVFRYFERVNRDGAAHESRD